MSPAPFKSDNSLIEQIPVLLGQWHCGRHDDVNGALGDVGHGWRRGKTEVENGGVDREGFHAAGFRCEPGMVEWEKEGFGVSGDNDYISLISWYPLTQYSTPCGARMSWHLA